MKNTIKSLLQSTLELLIDGLPYAALFFVGVGVIFGFFVATIQLIINFGSVGGAGVFVVMFLLFSLFAGYVGKKNE